MKYWVCDKCLAGCRADAPPAVIAMTFDTMMGVHLGCGGDMVLEEEAHLDGGDGKPEPGKN